MLLTRRGFLGAAAATGAVAGCRTLSLAGGDRPLLRIGVVSDVHVRLAKDGGGLEDGYGVETFVAALEYYRDHGVDAVVIAGDMADSGLAGELKAIADAWYRVFPGDRAPDGRKVERIFTFGNHDAYGRLHGGRVAAGGVRGESIEADPRRVWDECFHEEWKPFFAKSVNGFDFFGAHWQPGVWCNGYAETACSGCKDAFAGLMEKCDPTRPFFYVQHPHPRGTVYGKCAWGVDDGSATELLSRFPNAVAFSGHSHEPLTNELSIWRGEFTSVATGTLRHLAASEVWNLERQAGYENGTCNIHLPGLKREDRPFYYAKYDAPKMMSDEARRRDVRIGQLVSVYDDRIGFDRREFVSGLDVGEPWVVELPARPRSFAVRAKEARPAQFPSDATLSAVVTTAKTRGLKRAGCDEIPSVERPALRLSFPAATEGGVVVEYEIAASNAAGERRETRICAVGGLYPRRHGMFARPVSATVPLAALPAGALSVEVTPLDSFGNRGRPLVANARPLVVGVAEQWLGGRDGREKSPQAGVREDYVEAIRRGGNIPVVVCRTSEPGQLAQAIAQLDMLILPGGADIEPWRFGAEPEPGLGKTLPDRDAFDFALLDAALARKLPVVGICRGMQVINAYFGGTLFQDLPSTFPESAIGHRKDPLGVRSHAIAIDPGSRLAAATGATNAVVNSRHHQAVDRLAPGFKVTARAPDGVVEAIEHESLPVAGVQFHPEGLVKYADDDFSTRLFANLPAFAGSAAKPAERTSQP